MNDFDIEVPKSSRFLKMCNIEIAVTYDACCAYQVLVDVMDKDDRDEWFPFAIVTALRVGKTLLNMLTCLISSGTWRPDRRRTSSTSGKSFTSSSKVRIQH